MHFIKYYLNSILAKLTITLLLICVPFAFISISSIYHSRTVMVDTIKSAHQNMLKTYTQQIDTEMKNARNYANSLTLNNPITLPLSIDQSSSEFYYASNKLKNNVTSTLINYQYVNGFFIYIPKTNFYYTLINDVNAISDKTRIRDFLSATVLSSQTTNASWLHYTIGSTEYIISVTQHNGIYSGCYVNLAQLIKKLSIVKTISWAPVNSIPNLKKNLGKNNLLLFEPSAANDLTLYETIDVNSLFSELPFVQKYVLYISTFIILLIPIFFILLNFIIIRPLKKLTKAMNEIQNGNLDYRIKSFHYSNEFNHVNGTFNDMIHQLNELKIAVYEEKLSHEKSRLNNLQIQLRPHFMVNSLNMIYNLVANQDYPIALDLLRFSANYLRYMLKIKEDFVPLDEELKHIQNYLNIQLLRYPDTLSYSIELDSFIETVPVPPLFIQNFIENSLKYAIIPDRKAEITLNISYVEKDMVPFVHIHLRDNGNGYPENLLEPLNLHAGELLDNSIGLKNSLERAQILYGGRAILSFYNDQGAVNDFLLPIL